MNKTIKFRKTADDKGVSINNNSMIQIRIFYDNRNLCKT